MNAIYYKNYAATIEYSAEDDCFIGKVSGIDDVIGFHGDSVVELHQAFKEAIDDYVETCKKINKKAQESDLENILLEDCESGGAHECSR